MNKRVLLSAGAALVVLTSACSSNSTATPSSITPTTSADSNTSISSSETSATDSSALPSDTSSALPSDTSAAMSGDSTSSGTSGDSTSSGTSGMSDGSMGFSSAPSITEPSSGGSESTPTVSSAPTTANSTPLSITATAGATSGKLDAQTTAWFTTFCTGLSPLKNLSSTLLSGGGATDLNGVATKITNTGKELSATASKLKNQPPPTFAGGAGYGTKGVAVFQQLGTIFTQLGQKAAKGDISGMSTLTSQINSGPLKDIQQVRLEPATARAIGAIPACQKANFGG